MDLARVKFEDKILTHYLPRNIFRFRNIGAPNPYLQAAIQARDGAVYLLYFDISEFPTSKPRVYVQQMLYTHSGQPMDSCSVQNHTLKSWNGWTQLCHYIFGDSDITLWKVYLMCRIWIEMYRAHLRTGKPIDYYLNHQHSSEDTVVCENPTLTNDIAPHNPL